MKITAQSALPRLAVIGCGAAAKEFCLPVLKKYQGFAHSVVLVDNSEPQARLVARELGIQDYCTNYRNLPFEIDAAIVTTPHHLHAEQAIHFLHQGKPVFVEKPLGMSAGEVTRMVKAADSNGATLMVNNCRRLFPSYRRIHELLNSGDCGEIHSVHISDGSPFEWSSVSDFYLRNAELAKGVFLDRGAHTVDVVCWWLSGWPRVINAQHDASGGAEARFHLQMALDKTDVVIEFSRLHKLENCFRIECEKARITGRLFQPSRFQVERDGQVKSVQAGKPLLYNMYAWELLENFIDVVQGSRAPLFTAADVAPSIALIDEAYQQATPFDMPWYRDDPNLALLRSQFETRQP